MPKMSKAQPTRAGRTVHQFSLIFSGPTELTQELEDSLYEAGCSDALLGIQDGHVFLDFHREAPSFRIALMSAIADVECAGVGLELIRVEPA